MKGGASKRHQTERQARLREKKQLKRQRKEERRKDKRKAEANEAIAVKYVERNT
jgi:hypothetical protein